MGEINEFSFPIEKSVPNNEMQSCILYGLPKCGKTTALSMLEGCLIIDTENGSADLYSDLGDYNVLPINFYSPEKYIEAITACEKAGMEVIIIDSTTHEWDYLLQVHSKMEGNSYTNWNKITPRHNAFIQKILQSSCHIFTTVRRKTEYEMQEIAGRKQVVKLGTKEETRINFEYELTINLEIIQRIF